MSTSSPPVIRVANLRKSFGTHAVVQDVSFELTAGETLVLLGPSGCGKTTLLKMLNRLIEPDSGTVEINGRDVRQQATETLRRGMGYVIQQVGLLPHYTVAENIAVVPKLLGHSPQAIAERTTALLTRLHLPPERYAGQLPQQLSGGQQQRVGLARALAADPPIILMDEPFGALDPLTRASIRREFRELEELKSKTVVLVTHDVTEAFELADRIMLLDSGKIQQLGTPRELLFQPANDFVRSFFAVERLALQLRTLTLGDVFASYEVNNIPGLAHNIQALAQNSQSTLSSATGAAHNPEHTVNNSGGGVNNLHSNPSIAVANKQSADAKPFIEQKIDSGFTETTTVQEALEDLTGPASTTAPFTVAQLMAAFGEALQREEDAWTR